MEFDLQVSCWLPAPTDFFYFHESLFFLRHGVPVALEINFVDVYNRDVVKDGRLLFGWISELLD